MALVGDDGSWTCKPNVHSFLGEDLGDLTGCCDSPIEARVQAGLK
jgi:hypothetical protein